MTRSQRQSLARAEGLWFEDCGLIIQADSTLFRVSRDFLAARSPVFEGMLSLPAPRNADKMDGCPFVRLPDSAQDITVFLKALLYSESFEPYPAPTTFTVIASVLRMSHKYEVDALRKRALAHLSAVHPTKLGRWTRLQTPLFLLPPQPVALEIALLARQTSALWLLPIALYRVCEYTHESDIIVGTNDGQLGPVDQVACVKAIRWLETAGASKILDFLWVPATIMGCFSLPSLRCQTSRMKARIVAETWRESEPGTSALLPLTLWGEADWERLEVCDTCLQAMKGAHAKAKQEIWNKLPELFDLPPWTELERMKAEALR
ncbi:hypothetical protein B0H15DRAFT_783297 [Mycena belliarum]|uniref:BTB domain-containing protein n=1 Tax=Mycena belliarum TaxID=1033014 RepID=A0AAD6U512_9AGAR|nr:hypothetical protein B0H15DRAFT_783297 [Mycena belliae]